jgi:hypothetical protein
MKIIVNFLIISGLAVILASCSNDDPTIVLPKISIDDVIAAEGDGLLFTVSLDMVSQDTVEFSYKTIDGTATASDYHAVTSKITGGIYPGETSVQIGITTKTDALTEEDEIFKIVLSDPVNCSINNEEGIGTITNKDAPPASETYYMKAKINGKQWTALMTGWLSAEFIGSSFAGYGTDNDSQLSFLFYHEPTGSKTYEIEELGVTGDANVSVYYSPNFFTGGLFGPVWNGQPGGKFKLTSYNTTSYIAEGTFELTGKNPDTGTLIEITEGSFRVPINH